MHYQIKMKIKEKIINRICNAIRTKQLSKKNIGLDQKSIQTVISKAIILIHTGKKPLPEYAIECIKQIRLLDKEIMIFFICSRKKNASVLFDYCNVVYEEDLICSNEHLEFIKNLSHMSISKFVQVTIERFFVLYDAMLTLGITQCLHLENDNLLYINATELIDKLSEYYNRVATPREFCSISIASIMFIPSQGALTDFLKYVNSNPNNVYFNDMALLPAYVDEGRGMTLPIIDKNYVDKNGLKTVNGIDIREDEREEDYYNFAKELNGVFDGAAKGQYLDGCDIVMHPQKRAGYINENTYVDPSKILLHWIKNADGLVIPYIICGDKKYRVFNLHIHSKRLGLFCSDYVKETDISGSENS